MNFYEHTQADFKIYTKAKVTRTLKAILKKKIARGITLPGFKTHCIDTVIGEQ